jgi:hypothetical protein
MVGKWKSGRVKEYKSAGHASTAAPQIQEKDMDLKTRHYKRALA